MNMNVSPQEAERSLGEIESITHRLRQCLAGSGAGVILVMWGVIWLIGYGCSQFYPQQSGLVWAPLCLGGGLASWIIGARSSPVRAPGAWRIGIFWLALFAYALLWLILLAPASQKHLGAYIGTVPMFAYVVGGLWFGRFFTWLGLAVTGLIVLGVFAWPGWSDLWTGLAGGGSLVLAGFYIRRFWR